ncbi:M1 family metallopeptidase [Gemmatimonadota bacterium]
MNGFLRKCFSLLAVAFFTPGALAAQHWLHDDGSRTNQSMFRAIDWPDPTNMRNAAGSPGSAYWQQQVDYVIEARLDTLEHAVYGSEHITYQNNSPDRLRYLWVQLDQNVRSIEHSRSYKMQEALSEELSPRARRFLGLDRFDGGHNITRVQVMDNGALNDTRYIINNTVMRVDLPTPLESGSSVELEIDWNFRVPDQARGSKELVSDGWLYQIAQWFPRLAVYDDVNGWQTDQFLGSGEFYLEFGNYDVKLTVPWSHIVDASGVLQNPDEVLTQTQRERLAHAMTSEEPMFIIPVDEVLSPETRPVQSGELTWHYVAENVRDFAWVSSKSFVWDAAGFRYEPDGRLIEAHSFYPREAMPLWDSLSTKVIIQTFKTYGRMAFEYPYPKASNVNGGLGGGMEYPMMAFCGGRPNADGTIPVEVAHWLITVTAHEVGHNWFPMIVASDERKWGWMDEGLNTFLQYYTELDWDAQFPTTDGSAVEIVNHMRNPDQAPIMTAPDIIHRAGFETNYTKPATGLVILREQVLGEELFDAAFQEYAQKWMFKKPQPADFFRSMDDGAGELLNWFWRGWFYTTHYNDQVLASVSAQSAKELVGNDDRGQSYYRVQVDNEGGLVMPLHIGITYQDGTRETVKLPADIWRSNELTFTYGFFTNKTIVGVVLDPNMAFADVNRDNNTWTAPIP